MVARIDMSSSKNQKALKNPVKWAAILKAAESIFAKKGFYEYFSSKEELLFSIPARTTLQYEEKNREILKYIQGAANKLRFMIYRHLGLYAENPDYANIVMLILKGHRNFQKTDAYKIVQATARRTIHVLEEGIQSGEFRADIQPLLVRAIIWGTIEHLVTRKCLLGKPDNLLELADDLIATIFQGILAPRKEPTFNVNLTWADKNQFGAS
jgi:TetR/AcrR family fatty acid metabolism transcriptional regulator